MLVSVESYRKGQEVEAGLYLLQRLLDLDDQVLGVYRTRLLQVRGRLVKNQKINSDEKNEIVSIYREVIG